MTNITPFKKAIAGGLAALTLATSIVALSSVTASAQWRGRGWGPGPGFAAGVVGGLAVGGLSQVRQVWQAHPRGRPPARD